MPYTAKNFDHLIGTPGFSDQLLKNHFTLYQGYVTNINKLNDILVALEKDGKFGTPEYAELNRRFGWEWNGMRLHELYFENMAKSGTPLASDGALADAIRKEFGSLDLWQKDFTSMGAMRGIGWTILYQDPIGNRLFNVWVNEHDLGHLAGCKPLLVLDVFEHAYMLDYGLKRADYINAFLQSIDWKTVSQRFG
ncbi:MAG: superoxide dismutase [Candidatus Harrisonbacteria bacterium RIFCSPLOWO2_02_FULL_45_10c]|uniref:superoxide dismutase n=1 Tax=Candidatus Harrisonbacteria bacterium RIFCSPLOWO2_02_FULL_45_10c TaxID=1798410 RepID=A0A1G1ZQP5_9BACT|nr:MAG: superoxide dismutase [Candidatus Harrisonbacteria bacterium RIFCSPLOWO2_02_FULL_45_10c]